MFNVEVLLPDGWLPNNDVTVFARDERLILMTVGLILIDEKVILIDRLPISTNIEDPVFEAGPFVANGPKSCCEMLQNTD